MVEFSGVFELRPNTLFPFTVFPRGEVVEIRMCAMIQPLPAFGSVSVVRKGII